MIPLRDSTRSNSIPYVNLFLIGLNIAVFVYQLSLNERTAFEFIYNYGVIPTKYTSVPIIQTLITNPIYFFPLLSSVFMHGGLLHIIGNMLYLWVFGDNIEDRFGHFRYLIFYLSVVVAGHIAHIASHPSSDIPTIGASGAVAGILGAYFLAFPKAKVLTLVPLFIFFTIIEVPALIFLFLWFVLQLINGLTIFGNEGAQTVAWWAHIGGFIGGALLYNLFKKNPQTNYNRWE
jgi:membrane associated rhomboid family serine protease